MIGGFPQKLAYPYGGPYNKEYTIVGSILGSSHFVELPFGVLV